MYEPDDAWSYSPSDVDLEEHVNSWDHEDFTNLSEENLLTLKKSFSETLRQRKSHMNLLMNLKDCPNKENLIEEIQAGVQSLEHDLRCLTSELDNRKSVKSKKCDEFIFPTITSTSEDDTLDLTLLKQLIGTHFNSDDKLTFKSQCNALVHYSKSTPLNERQINQIFTIMLKGHALQYYTSLDPSLPLRVKIRNLLTVYSYRSSIGDRLNELESFERKPFEAMDSVYLRLSAVLDATASLIPPASRTGRAEHVLCQAIYSLALPSAKHRLTRFQLDKTQNGQFLTSRELLKAAIRFEEGLTNQIHEPLQFCFKDPFINSGEIRKGKGANNNRLKNTEASDGLYNDGCCPGNHKPVPNFWENQAYPSNAPSKDEDLKKNIQELSQQIDRLSQAYSQKMSTSGQEVTTPIIAESHAIDDISNPTQQAFRAAPEKRLNDILESFLQAQYDFYKNFNYTSAPEQQPSFLRFQKWGSNFEKADQYGRGFGGNRYKGVQMHNQEIPNRTFGYGRQTPSHEFRSQRFETMPRNFRARVNSNLDEGIPQRLPLPKRVRFSEFLQRQSASNGNRQNKMFAQQTNSDTHEGGKRDDNDGIRKEPRSFFSPKIRGSKRQLESNGNGLQLSRDGSDSGICSGNNTDDIPSSNFQTQQSN